jgi:predicted membrane protein
MNKLILFFVKLVGVLLIFSYIPILFYLGKYLCGYNEPQSSIHLFEPHKSFLFLFLMLITLTFFMVFYLTLFLEPMIEEYGDKPNKSINPKTH